MYPILCCLLSVITASDVFAMRQNQSVSTRPFSLEVSSGITGGLSSWRVDQLRPGLEGMWALTQELRITHSSGLSGSVLNLYSLDSTESGKRGGGDRTTFSIGFGRSFFDIHLKTVASFQKVWNPWSFKQGFGGLAYIQFPKIPKIFGNITPYAFSGMKRFVRFDEDANVFTSGAGATFKVLFITGDASIFRSGGICRQGWNCGDYQQPRLPQYYLARLTGSLRKSFKVTSHTAVDIVAEGGLNREINENTELIGTSKVSLALKF